MLVASLSKATKRPSALMSMRSLLASALPPVLVTLTNSVVPDAVADAEISCEFDLFVLHAEPDTERYLMFESVSTMLSGLAKRAPLLLVLDDLHLADRPTARQLA
jgi:hypothetical protein